MMEEDIKKLSFSSNDQFYHILKTDTFTFCLICLEDINSTFDDVGKHLGSANHGESLKCLFKACNPSLIDDIEGNRYTDMVLKSVFDISVLLGRETCYISKKDEYWFCLMCEQSVTESDLVDAAVKDHVIDHVLSDCHVKRVKDVCFLYRLNVNQDFLLLNKSVVYCSICKDVMQCREVDLLNIAAVHLEKKHSNCAIPHGFKCDTSCLYEGEEHKMTEERFRPNDGGISCDLVKSKNILSFELAEEEKDKSLIETVKYNSMHNNLSNHTDVNKSFDKNQCFSNKFVCFCWCCKKEIKILSGQSFEASINNHFRQKHCDVYMKTSLEGLMNRIIIHFDPNKIKLLSETVVTMKKSFITFIKEDSVIKKNFSYILNTKTAYLCILCLVSMSSRIDNDLVVSDNMHNHFVSLSHCQCHKEKKETIKAFENRKKNKTKVKLTQEKDVLCKNGGSLVEAIKDTSVHSSLSNHRDTKNPFSEKYFFHEKNTCICLLCKCKLKVSYVSGQMFLVSMAKHFKGAHQNFYIKTSLKNLIKNVIFLNDPDEIKLFSEVQKMDKSLKKLFQRTRGIKNHAIYILKTKKDYVCIICFVTLSLCLVDNVVLLEHLKNHFHSSSHQQCERDRKKINKAFKISEKDGTAIQLTKQKEKLKKELTKQKALRKLKQANKKAIKQKLKQKSSRSNNLEGKHKINQQVKIELCQ